MGKFLITAGIIGVGYATGILQIMLVLMASALIWLASFPAFLVN
jgi:hypothetical protein